MKFREWLNENKEKPKIMFGGFFKDGRVIVYIDGKRYEYVTDAVYHEKWKTMINKNPLEVLNQIKKVAYNQE